MTELLSPRGLSLSDVVSVCLALRDMSDYSAINSAYVRHFGANPPVRVCVQAETAAAVTMSAVGYRSEVSTVQPASLTFIFSKTDGPSLGECVCDRVSGSFAARVNTCCFYFWEHLFFFFFLSPSRKGKLIDHISRCNLASSNLERLVGILPTLFLLPSTRSVCLLGRTNETYILHGFFSWETGKKGLAPQRNHARPEHLTLGTSKHWTLQPGRGGMGKKNQTSKLCDRSSEKEIVAAGMVVVSLSILL